MLAREEGKLSCADFSVVCSLSAFCCFLPRGERAISRRSARRRAHPPRGSARTAGTATSSLAAATPATNPVSRLDGTLAAVGGTNRTLKEGGRFSLSPKTAFLRRTAAGLSELIPGKVVHVTAKRQPHGSLLATAIGVDSSSSNAELKA